MLKYPKDSLNKKNFLQVLRDPGLKTQDGTVAQVCSALPLSSKSSSIQQLYRDTVETQAYVCLDLLPTRLIHLLNAT